MRKMNEKVGRKSSERKWNKKWGGKQRENKEKLRQTRERKPVKL